MGLKGRSSRGPTLSTQIDSDEDIPSLWFSSSTLLPAPPPPPMSPQRTQSAPQCGLHRAPPPPLAAGLVTSCCTWTVLFVPKGKPTAALGSAQGAMSPPHPLPVPFPVCLVPPKPFGYLLNFDCMAPRLLQAAKNLGLRPPTVSFCVGFRIDPGTQVIAELRAVHTP